MAHQMQLADEPVVADGHKTEEYAGFFTVVNSPLGLRGLIEEAVGLSNHKNINSDITSERFKLGQDVREVNLEIVRFKNGERGLECIKRLAAEGYTLENTGELAAFLKQHPKEVEKYSWVFALGEDSQWKDSIDRVYVPFTVVYGVERYFYHFWIGNQFYSDDGVLVSRKQP